MDDDSWRMEWQRAKETRVEPTPIEIREMCFCFQQHWSTQERRQRQAGIEDQVISWTVPQFLVHHEECGRWIGGTARKTQVWRCVDGR